MFITLHPNQTMSLQHMLEMGPCSVMHERALFTMFEATLWSTCTLMLVIALVTLFFSSSSVCRLFL
jgi:hypothetical protein